MKVQKKLLDLVTIYEKCKVGELLELLTASLEAKEELEFCVELLNDEILYNPMPNNEIAEEINTVNNQLFYIKKNIKTLEVAILCHESKIFQQRTIGGIPTAFCLN